MASLPPRPASGLCGGLYEGEAEVHSAPQVMDRHCGTCLSGQDAKCKQYQKDVDWGNEPWICCCSVRRGIWQSRPTVSGTAKGSWNELGVSIDPLNLGSLVATLPS